LLRFERLIALKTSVSWLFRITPNKLHHYLRQNPNARITLFENREYITLHDLSNIAALLEAELST
jgi:hypothetical protein